MSAYSAHRPVVAECLKGGTRRIVHGDIVAAYCAEFAIWIYANESLNKLGLIVRSGDKTKIHPLLAVRDTASKNMSRLGRKIGLQPGTASKAIQEWKEWRQVASLDGVEEVIVDDDSGEGNGNAGTTGSNPQR